MTITFENDNAVIVYPFEKVIAYARRTHQIFVAQCIWWLAAIIGHEQGLISHIDHLQLQENKQTPQPEPLQVSLAGIHPHRISQVEFLRGVSTVPRDLTEAQRLNRILESAETVIQDSFRDRAIVQKGRLNPLPGSKMQLKKARKIKRLQKENRKRESQRSQRLREIRATVIWNPSKE
jgi:hypothetical protein